MATILEVPKHSFFVYDHQIFQKVGDKETFERVTKTDKRVMIDFCTVRHVNNGTDMSFQWDVEVRIIPSDKLAIFTNIPVWSKFKSGEHNYLKVVGDETFNAVCQDCTPTKFQQAHSVEIL